MKIQLSLSEDYCRDWGAWEGVRELVQNWLDARDEGYDGKVSYSAYGGTLTLTNKGARVTAAQMGLLGETTKADREDLRGQFGEGAKIGILALVRQGFEVTVRSGEQFFRAGIEASRQFGRRVLAFTARKNPEFDGVQVRVKGLTEDGWREIKRRILPLRDLGDKVFKTTAGDLLLQEAERGQVYVRGIWVGQYDDLEYGYDFHSDGVRVDRDRRMVSDWDLNWYASAIAARALKDDVLTGKQYLDLYAKGRREARGGGANHNLGQEGFDKVGAEFARRHGENAVPTRSEEESRVAAHYGMKGVESTCDLVELFDAFHSGKDRVDEAKQAVDRTYGWEELDPAIQTTVLRVYNLLREAKIPFDADVISFVDFVDPALLGQFERDDGRVEIRVAVKAASNPVGLLKTLVEELAHHEGSDGSMDHKQAIHDIYGKIIVHLCFGGKL